MIFDDHDVHDDWNISEAWVSEMRATPWWEERIVGAFMAYWLYQHLGNLAPPELAEERLLAELAAATRTAARGCASSRTRGRPRVGRRAASRSTATSAARGWS